MVGIYFLVQTHYKTGSGVSPNLCCLSRPWDLHGAQVSWTHFLSQELEQRRQRHTGCWLLGEHRCRVPGCACADTLMSMSPLVLEGTRGPWIQTDLVSDGKKDERQPWMARVATALLP